VMDDVSVIIGNVLNYVSYSKNDHYGGSEILRCLSKKSTPCLSVLLVHLHTPSYLFNRVYRVYKGHDFWDTPQNLAKINLSMLI
jgi:hypothetical protein